MIKVKVPATSANIGPGFDCLGMALSLYNKFYFKEIEEGLIIEGGDPEFANESNLVYLSMKKTFEKIGYKCKGIKIKIEDNIPASRGLGSSAACIVGGIMGANEMAGRVLGRDEMLNLATEIEGHPDNVTPALIGGITVSISEDSRVYYSKINIAEGLKFYGFVPEFKLSTSEARAVLPERISYEDGVFNVGRVSLLISALVNGEFELIKTACNDRLHQIYRGRLIAEFEEIKDACNKLGSKGVFISGAGPTIMSMVEKTNCSFYEKIQRILSKLSNKWEVKEFELDLKGATTGEDI
ncbi:MAG: homoserine kinase [Candidatus Petromonas sp.]|jgi:homoserine kinase|nr:homoserine kinase [Candidatus Petromonas sp.]